MAQKKETKDYDQAVVDFGKAVEAINAARYDEARKLFTALIESVHDEPGLVERSRMYLSVCDKRTAKVDAPGTGFDDIYHQAVMAMNSVDTEGSIRLLDQALQHDPTSVRVLYARSSAWALSGNAESAVSDLRQAIAGDPTIRFQAVNDADFERIREEPAFIDIIEPTTTGA